MTQIPDEFSLDTTPASLSLGRTAKGWRPTYWGQACYWLDGESRLPTVGDT